MRWGDVWGKIIIIIITAITIGLNSLPLHGQDSNLISCFRNEQDFHKNDFRPIMLAKYPHNDAGLQPRFAIALRKKVTVTNAVSGLGVLKSWNQLGNTEQLATTLDTLNIALVVIGFDSMNI